MAAHGGRNQKQIFHSEALPHLDAIYTAALSLTKSRDDAEDLCQETLLRALRSFHQFTPGTNCRAWLLTILYNIFRNRHRRGGREQVAASERDFEQALEHESIRVSLVFEDAPERAFDHLLDTQIKDAISNLPDDFRTALELVDLQDLTYQDTAQIMGVPIGTVRSRLSRARALLRESLRNLAQARGVRRA